MTVKMDSPNPKTIKKNRLNLGRNFNYNRMFYKTLKNRDKRIDNAVIANNGL